MLIERHQNVHDRQGGSLLETSEYSSIGSGGSNVVTKGSSNGTICDTDDSVKVSRKESSVDNIFNYEHMGCVQGQGMRN